MASSGGEGRKPVQSREDPILYAVCRYFTWSTKECWYAEATFEDRSLRLREGRLAAVRPRKDFGPVIGREDNDGVVILPDILELLHDQADVIIQLSHAGFLFRPAVLRVAHRFIFWRKMRNDMHARRIEPDEERLVIRLGLVYEL